MSAEARREQILDVTHAIITAEGFHAATPNRIAETAGVNRSLLYQQFGDPAKLFVALIDREAARAAAQFAQAVSSTSDSGANPALRAFDSVLDAVDASPATWRLFLLPPQGAPPELYERLNQAQAIVREHLIARLRRLGPDLEDPEYTARILQAVCRELLQLRLTEPESATRERLHSLARRFGSELLPGIRP
ncbi:TetR/AcrR family transcriptional regulator [Nocardia sp. 2]|uniref:TetR/AcrR family transcriptional regulator n=1 Tax=Nocardia acididurans TaxID=2802282 RepID=A0ABS1MHS3_9NOCA|nr:TetR/AcrR family transcriptional regulator [Nocardia acididurans]MBL1080203.1 TetR/AcrR family transcriptional regulator [Nocardia acididurans]